MHDWHLPEVGTEKAYVSVTKKPYEQKFFAVLEALDREIGRFLTSLEKEGLVENTIILVSSNNGPTDWACYYNAETYPPDYQGNLYPPGSNGGFWGRKWSLHKGGIRVPLIAYWKNHFPANSTDLSTVGAIFDLYPTLAAILNINISEPLDGISLTATQRFYTC